MNVQCSKAHYFEKSEKCELGVFFNYVVSGEQVITKRT